MLHSNTSNFFAGIKLDENNYSLWHQIIEMKIVKREKHGHLTGDIAQPAVINSIFNKWHSSDYQVKSCCLMSCNLIRLKGLLIMTQQSKFGM
jgi:hypothetical protein